MSAFVERIAREDGLVQRTFNAFRSTHKAGKRSTNAPPHPPLVRLHSPELALLVRPMAAPSARIIILCASRRPPATKAIVAAAAKQTIVLLDSNVAPMPPMEKKSACVDALWIAIAHPHNPAASRKMGKSNVN